MTERMTPLASSPLIARVDGTVDLHPFGSAVLSRLVARREGMTLREQVRVEGSTGKPAGADSL